MDIAFLGTGLIGAGMVENLLTKGHRVRVWNRTPAKAAALAERGAVVAATVAEAVAGAERVHLALTDDASVDAVIEAALPALPRVPVAGASGAGAAPAALLIDHTTTAPRPTAARIERLGAAGVTLVHAPVFMSPAMCRDAKGLMVCSGPEALYQRVRPWLEEMTGVLWWMGERPDLAAANKLFGNALILTIVGGLADVYALGRSVGIEPEQAFTLFTKLKAGAGIEARGPRMARGEFDPPSFALEMARKDLRLMLETAGDTPLAVLPGMAARMDALIAAGQGARDVGVLAIDPALAPTQR